MGYIFYVMGKSAAGKDTIYKELVRRFPEYGTVRMYTTRPIRDGEQEGVEYYFTDEARLKKLESQGKVIECRTYDTAVSYTHLDVYKRQGQTAGVPVGLPRPWQGSQVWTG